MAGVLRNLLFMRHSPPQVLEVNPPPPDLGQTRQLIYYITSMACSSAVVPEFVCCVITWTAKSASQSLFIKPQLAQQSDKAVICSHNAQDEDVLHFILQVLLQHGRLKMGHKQQPLRSKGEAGGAFVVISGIVRVACESGDGVAFEDAFLGAGLFCLTCHR